MEMVNDLQQYGDLLFIYTESDVYEVSKTDLISQSTTAIRPVVTDVNASATYDLQGRRITQPKRGIHIKEGRKILK